MANLSNINNKFLVTTGGNVGIGTTAPPSKLTVMESTLCTNSGTDGGTSYVPAKPILLVTTDGNGTASSYYATNSVFTVGIGGGITGGVTTEHLRVNLNGNVGIGTDSPVAPLQIERASNTTLALSNSGSVTSGTRGEIAVYNSSVSTCAAIKAVADTDNVGTGLEFYTRPVGGALTERMRINSSGNVGIGIDTPTLVAGKIVHIHGTAAGVHLTDTASGTTSADGSYVAFDNPNLYIQNKEAGSMFFETSGTTALTIDSSQNSTFAGNVGIGVTADASVRTFIKGADTGTNNFQILTRNSSDTNILAVRNDGNVGIGTASPTARLNVKASGSTVDQIAVTHSGNAVEIAQLGQSANGNSAGALLLKTNGGTDKVYLDAAGDSYFNGGNVAIGTTVMNGKLSVAADDTSSTPPLSSGIYVGPYQGNTAVGSAWSYSNSAATYTDFSSRYNSSDSRMRFIMKASATPVYAMTIKGDGIVGIGTDSPTAAFQVGGGTANVLQKIWGSGTAGLQIFTNSPSSGTKIAALEQWFSNEGSLQLLYNGSTKVLFRANDNSYINGGNLGIGTTAPTAKLQVEMNASSSFHSFFQNNNVSGYGAGFQSYSGVQVYFYDTGGNIGSITSNGSNTSYNTSGSDERLKENIEVWDENVLDKFKNLQPKTFKFIKHKQNDKTVKGYIAQNEVDNFPEAYPMVYDIDAKEDMYQFNPSGMTVYLMKAIQELKAEIELLKSK